MSGLSIDDHVRKLSVRDREEESSDLIRFSIVSTDPFTTRFELAHHVPLATGAFRNFEKPV